MYLGMSVSLLHESIFGFNKLNLALHNSYHFYQLHFFFPTTFIADTNSYLTRWLRNLDQILSEMLSNLLNLA